MTSRLVGGLLLAATKRRSLLTTITPFNYNTRPELLLAVHVNGTRRELATNVSLQEKKKASSKVRNMIKKAQTKSILVKPGMTARELAEAMNKPTQLVYDCLRQLGLNWLTRRDSVPITSLNTIIDVVRLCGFRHQLPAGGETDFEALEAELLALNDCIDKRPRPGVKDLVKRPPVVTIMGHVDHGKTTLLDALRGSNSVEKEFGGITQHIGAFNVRLGATTTSNRSEDRNITFLDTPGHAAFNSMRSRGARLTDIVVLVIAAEDSIMAQTVESIEHARASECPIIVAINKCDKATPVQIERVKKDLLQQGLVPEEMGGEVQVVPISALQRTNLDRLKEEIWAQAEVMELRGERGPQRGHPLAEGYVIESTQDTYKGKLATVLVTRGVLDKGDYLVAGTSWCKIKALNDENESEMRNVSLSQAVRVMGWRGDHLPQPGDEVIQVTSENKAKELVALRQRIETVRKQKADAEEIKKKREEHEKQYHDKLVEKRATGSKRPVTAISIDQVVKKLAEQRLRRATAESDPSGLNSENIETASSSSITKTLSVIIKADVNGSLEAILNVLETYDRHDQVRIDLTHFDVGPVKKSDLDLAAAFNSVIYCFNLPTNQALEEVNLEDSSSQNYKIKHFNVIYKLFDDMKSELNERAPLVDQEEVVGQATVFKPFTYDEPNGQTIVVAGARCMDGLVEKKSLFRLERNGQVIASGLACRSLKHFKNDINTAKKNTEFGLAFEDQSVQVEKGDTIVCYAIRKVKRPVEWNLGF